MPVDHLGRIIPKRHRRMSARAQSDGLKCLTCPNYTMNRGCICEWCLRPVIPRRKRNPLPLDVADRHCIRCDAELRGNERDVCAGCAREIDGLKVAIRAGELAFTEQSR